MAAKAKICRFCGNNLNSVEFGNSHIFQGRCAVCFRVFTSLLSFLSSKRNLPKTVLEKITNAVKLELVEQKLDRKEG